MSTFESSRDYNTWRLPDQPFGVSYSLSVFHEIDFIANEGYRRIPHGGIEMAGLLFGRTEGNLITVDAFRPIECEHAFGPSFKLSERDLRALRNQTANASSDPELKGLALVGWFIAHTRSPLQMNDQEAGWFDEFFPGPAMLTLLVKPEKFKPTLFAFLVRRPDGDLDRDGTRNAFILPLPGRASKSSPEPAAASIREQPATQPDADEPGPQPQFTSALPPKPVQRVLPQLEIEQPAAKPAPPVTEEAPALPQIENRPSFTGARQGTGPVQPPSIEQDLRAGHRRFARTVRVQKTRSKAQFTTILILAAALGCILGYWAYLQLPSATISVSLYHSGTGYLAAWPPAQTRDATYISIRINDGEPAIIPEHDKASGQTRVAVSTDEVKVDLMAHHWIRNSRGMVRFVKPLASPRQPAAKARATRARSPSEPHTERAAGLRPSSEPASAGP